MTTEENNAMFSLEKKNTIQPLNTLNVLSKFNLQFKFPRFGYKKVYILTESFTRRHCEDA